MKVDYVAGNSTDTLAKLQAQKGNQVIDVAIMDDGLIYQAIQLGFCAPIQGIHKFKPPPPRCLQARQGGRRRPDRPRFHDQHQGLQGERGRPTPSSWNDLKDPKFSKQLVIPPINNTNGLYVLMMDARTEWCRRSTFDPGFKVMKDDINPNVLVYEPSPGKMTEVSQSGQATIAVWGTARL